MTKVKAGSSYFDLWKLHLLSAEIQFLAKNLCIFGRKQKTVFAKHETGQTVKLFVFGTEKENKNETKFRSVSVLVCCSV